MSRVKMTNAEWKESKQRDLIEIGVDGSTASVLVRRLLEIQNPKTKTEEIMEFARELPKGVAQSYFYALINDRTLYRLTHEKIIRNKNVVEFAKEMSEDAAYSYFRTIANIVLLNGLTNKQVAEFIKELPENDSSTCRQGHQRRQEDSPGDRRDKRHRTYHVACACYTYKE